MEIVIALYPGFTGLDAIGPYQVFNPVPGVDVSFCAEHRGVVTDDVGLLGLVAQRSFDEVATADIVVVPGGLLAAKRAEDGDAVVGWVRDIYPATTWTMSVCTGALILGAAGLLEGKRANTHWLSYDILAGYGATPTSERVVIDGKIATAAGVSAGIDLALAMVGHIWAPEVAQAIQLGIEYDPQPPYDAGSPEKAPAEIRELVTAAMDQARLRAVERDGAAV